MKNANPTKWHFATAVFAVSAACLSQFCCAGGGCPFGAGTSALTPRIQRLLDRAIDHDVFPRPVKMEYDPADEKLPEPVRIGKRLREYMAAQPVAIREDEEICGASP